MPTSIALFIQESIGDCTNSCEARSSVSRWRRNAMESFPERQEWMERAPDLREVLWLLDGDARAAITSHSHTLENIVERAFAFALWCLDPSQARSVRETARRIFSRSWPRCPRVGTNSPVGFRRQSSPNSGPGGSSTFQQTTSPRWKQMSLAF